MDNEKYAFIYCDCTKKYYPPSSYKKHIITKVHENYLKEIAVKACDEELSKVIKESYC